jgi:uncharacterized SAM-binding protein YcdF (DUF218 family)
MARSWSGPEARLLVDRTASSTLGNVVGTAAAARSLAADEVVLVTSSWHGSRAAALLRAALRGSGSRVTLAVTEEQAPRRERAREAACWLVFPLQRAIARSRSSRLRRC